MDKSALWRDILLGRVPTLKFTINGHEYKQGYFNADGIYPEWSCLVRPIHEPTTEDQTIFTKNQEAVRKDVERAFGVLFARWHILANPGRFWGMDKMKLVWQACVILHNMVCEDERDQYGDLPDQCYLIDCRSSITVVQALSRPSDLSELWQRMHALHSSALHFQLRTDLIKHNWERYQALRALSSAR